MQSAIAAALRRLPPGMPNPPTFRKVNPADQPILNLSLNSPTLPLSAVDEYAETLISQRISMINGVAQVNVMGAQKYAVRAQLDPSLLAARGIGIDEVESALEQHNVNLPTGTLWGPRQAFTVQATGQLMNAAAFRPLIVAYRNGRPVRLEELGRVIDSVENDKVASWFNDARSITLHGAAPAGHQHGGSGGPHQGTAAQLPRADAALGQAGHPLRPLRIDSRIGQRRQVHAGADRRAGGDGDLPVPAQRLRHRDSQPGAAHVDHRHLRRHVRCCGYTLDNLSLMALTLSVGFVVDDAIVILENIVRHMEMGKPRMQAALEGAREIGFTILSMTLSLAAVFIPVLFMSGIMGRLFHEFAVTISVAILISGFVSLSLTPMLCSRFLKPPGEHQNAFQRGIASASSTACAMLYGWTLRGVLRHRFLTMLVAAGTLVATVYLYGLVPKGFIPNQDTGQIQGSTEAPQDISFDAMVQRQQQVADVVAQGSRHRRASPPAWAAAAAAASAAATRAASSCA